MMSTQPPKWGDNGPELFETSLPLATQLFPVWNVFSKDMVGTLKRIKEMGYDGVEFFGGLTFTAQDARRALDEAGLQIAGWHTPWHYLSPENIHSTITYNKVLDNRFLVVPWYTPEKLHTRAGCLKFAQELTWAADVLSKHDMVTGFHNHTVEFRPTDDTGELPWDIIAQNTPSNVIMQNDVGNGMHGGGDTVGALKKYPGRGGTVHVKPFSSKQENVHFDDAHCEIDWDDYFETCRKYAGVCWYIIEYTNPERFPDDPMAAIAAAAKWFKGRGGR